ncbi:PepSY-associated TM helix domain-containing protein [Pigmentiphaga sp. YJ18]|uniref:PepSY-associated TM helix domain-containing protein n=1 Tax=Pigmentiphaga sp. YJ18 TaxID=3134907 RepID=UPI003116A731
MATISPRFLRIAYLVHKWSSLVSTFFLLILCVTGLPLIFHEEIEQYLSPHPTPQTQVAGAPKASVDAMVARARAARPGEQLVSVAFPQGQAAVVVDSVPEGAPPGAPPHRQAFDLHSGEPTALLLPDDIPVMTLLLDLHKSLFAGLPGTLFVGAMGLLLAVAVISGCIVYAPFMRKLPFGAVRRDRTRRIKWLDLHNVLGIASGAWVLTVGVTGFVNSLHDPIAGQVRVGFMALTASYRHAPPPEHPGSIDAAIAQVRRSAPDMALVSVWFPGTRFSTPHHYAVFTRGNTPITSRMLSAALIDAEDGRMIRVPDNPWYTNALFVSQPLHFGDYGGLPLKILWAVLDVITIFVLGSGLYLWLGRPRGGRVPGAERRQAGAAALRDLDMSTAAARAWNTEPRSLRTIFHVPAWLALASAVGLASALLGDGGWDALSWGMLGIPVLAVAWALRRAPARG